MYCLVTVRLLYMYPMFTSVVYYLPNVWFVAWLNDEYLLVVWESGWAGVSCALLLVRESSWTGGTMCTASSTGEWLVLCAVFNLDGTGVPSYLLSACGVVCSQNDSVCTVSL